MRTLAALLAATFLTGCASEQEHYCDTVADHRSRLGEIAASGDPARALEVLPSYRDLREKAPGDIEDEWDVVVDAYEGLETALEDAGADTSYDAQDPPEGVSPEERRAIEGAADEVGSPATLEAMMSLEQHALDVCKTPLTG